MGTERFQEGLVTLARHAGREGVDQARGRMYQQGGENRPDHGRDSKDDGERRPRGDQRAVSKQPQSPCFDEALSKRVCEKFKLGWC